MSTEILFQAANSLALAGWAILVAGVLINLPWLRDRLAGLYWPLAMSLGYAVAVAAGWGRVDGGFGSLTEVRQLFVSDVLLLAGWVHYLAFDLLVAAFLAAETERLRLSRLVLVPVLPFAFLFGRVGFLLFHAIRFVYRGNAHEPAVDRR